MIRRRGSRLLKAIALFRWTKAVFLIAGGIAALRMNPQRLAHLRWRLEEFPGTYERRVVHQAIVFIARLNPHRIELLAVVAFAYAALFIVEGTGLWLEKRWAEYLTIIATSSLLPFEIYELVEKVTALRLIVLLLNAAILLYLVWRVRHHE